MNKILNIELLLQNPGLDEEVLLQLGSLLPQQHQVATPALPLHQPLTTTFEVIRTRCRQS